MIKISKSTMAVCPFCKKFINTDINILKHINAAVDSTALKHILSGKANLINCPECNENFYYEHCCAVYNTNKRYAVICITNNDTNILPKAKSAFYTISNMHDFKFRYVNEFIYLIEKVKIFEYNLDDRVFEMIKYKHIAVPQKMDINSKIILTNTRDNAMEFTVFDDFDLPVASHCVSIDTYFKEHTLLKKDFVSQSKIQWLKVDSAWAKKN